MDAFLGALRLVDAHCHRIVADPLDDEAFALWCTEATVPAAPGVSYLDSQVGLAVRRWCAPVLGLPAGAPAAEYLDQRRELGPGEVNRRLLAAAGLAALFVDTGLAGTAAPGPGQPVAALVDPSAFGAAVSEVVRLESLAEAVAGDGIAAADFPTRFVDALAAAVGDAVAVKSILAYRHGLDIDPSRPTAADVRAAAGRWLRSGGRLSDPVLLRFLLWSAVDARLPIQLHTGFGDRDATLTRSDPALLQPLCAATESTGVPLVLLHCYPYHRSAGWLAQVYPHVYVDVGLTVSYLGARATAVLAEYLELAPFGKLLYSSDAYGLAELYLVGAAQFRSSLARTLDAWIADGVLPAADARQLAAGIGADNARRLYHR